MARISFDPKFEQNQSTRAFSRVSVQEEILARQSGRYTDIIDSIEQQDWDAVADMTLQERVQKLLESQPFQIAMASCIMLNAAVIGGETDYPDLVIWHPIEFIFLIIFSAELLLRLFSNGLRAFFAPGEDQLWNLFDFCIVGLGIFDVVCEKLGTQPGASNSHHAHHDHDAKDEGGGVSTLFRMIRLLRILRIFKIVRFLKQLYMLAFGFVEAIQAICWVSTLMFFVLYLCSIVMVRTYGRAAQGKPEEIATVLVEQFGSIKTSMLSLFELMSNPGNLLIYNVLMQDFPLLTLFLIAFVIFGSFGMIAMLTGIISESMFEKNQTRAQEERQEREQKRDLLKQKCLELFASVEKDGDEDASPQDLEEVLPYVREMFEKLDLEYMEHDFDNIITICDTDDSGTISEAEFVAGILSLCDGVRAASIQEVYYLISQMSAKVKRMEVSQETSLKFTNKAIPELQEQIKKILQKLDSQTLQPQPPPTSSSVSPGFNAGLLTQSTETRLVEMRTVFNSTMDEHTERLSKKIDDLMTNVTEICKRPEPLIGTQGAVFNSGAKDIFLPHIGSKSKVDNDCPPVLPEWCMGDADNNAKGTSGRSFFSGERITPPAAGTVKSITPLSPPRSAANGTTNLLE